jgi:hypothetical protein
MPSVKKVLDDMVIAEKNKTRKMKEKQSEQ